MKNLMTLSVLVLSLLSLGACKKETPSTPQKLILGKWKFDKTHTKSVINNVTTEADNPQDPNAYLEIKLPDLLYLSYDGALPPSNPWQLDQAGKVFTFAGTDYAVLVLNKNSFVFSVHVVNQQGDFTTTYYCSR